MRKLVSRLWVSLKEVRIGFSVVFGRKPNPRAQAAHPQKAAQASVLGNISGKWKRGVAIVRDIPRRVRLFLNRCWNFLWNCCASIGAGFVILSLMLCLLEVNPVQVLRQDLNHLAALEVVEWAEEHPHEPLSKTQMLTLLADSDWPPELWGTVIQIAYCESSLRPGAVNDKNKPGNGRDGGLMQINSTVKPWPRLMEDAGLTFEDMTNPRLNLHLAYIGFRLDENQRKGSGLSHWRHSNGCHQLVKTNKKKYTLPLPPELPPLKQGEGPSGESTQVATQ